MRGIGSVRTAKLLYTGKEESGDEDGIGSAGTTNIGSAGTTNIGSAGTANIGSVGTAKPLPVISPQVSSWVTLFLW